MESVFRDIICAPIRRYVGNLSDFMRHKGLGDVLPPQWRITRIRKRNGQGDWGYIVAYRA